MKEIFLIGIDHRKQIITCDYAKEITKMICNLIHEEEFDLLAEEWSTDCEAENGITILKEIANNLNIKHINCEMSKKEQLKLPFDENDEEFQAYLVINQIPFKERKKQIKEEEIKQNFPVRENYWLNKINSITYNKCLFICGRDHLESFNKIIITNKIASLIKLNII